MSDESNSAHSSQWTLQYTEGSGIERQINITCEQLSRPGGIFIGRSGVNDIPIQEISLSRIQCNLYLDSDEKLYLIDKESENGTFVNGERLHPEQVRQITEDDRVRFAMLPVTLQKGGIPPSTSAKASDIELTMVADEFKIEHSVLDEFNQTTSFNAHREVSSREKSEKLIERILTFGARRPLISSVLILILTVIAFYGTLSLQVDTSYESMFSKEDSTYNTYKEVIDEFGSDNITLLYIKDQDIFDAEKLTRLEDLSFELMDMGSVDRVESLFTALNIRDNEGSLDLNPLMDITPETEEEISTVRDNALYSPLIRKELISDIADTTAVVVTAKNIEDDPAYNRKLYHALDSVLEKHTSGFESVFQMGPPRLNVEIEKGIFDDLELISPLSAVTLVVFIVLFLRTGVAALLPLTTAGASIFWTLGFMGLMGIPLNLLTASLPALVIVIGSTEDTHMLVSYLHGLKEQRTRERLIAISFMARHVGLPIFITSFTTAVGFLSNITSDITLIRDFGLASSFAMLANLVATILLLPLILRYLGPRKARIKQPSPQSNQQPLIIRLVKNISEHHQ